jgi:hypothetical protein
MATSIAAGEVLHWATFQFEDGSSQNKFFVVLGAKPGHNMLFTIATSRKKRRRYDPGCNEQEGYFHIPNGGRNVFELDTWLLLMECREVELKTERSC